LGRRRGCAGRLRRSLEQAMVDGGSEVRREDLKKRSLALRALSWLAYYAVRLAIGVAGYGAGREYSG
jgi:cardiolipin synthase